MKKTNVTRNLAPSISFVVTSHVLAAAAGLSWFFFGPRYAAKAYDVDPPQDLFIEKYPFPSMVYGGTLMLCLLAYRASSCCQAEEEVGSGVYFRLVEQEQTNESDLMLPTIRWHKSAEASFQNFLRATAHMGLSVMVGLAQIVVAIHLELSGEVIDDKNDINISVVAFSCLLLNFFLFIDACGTHNPSGMLVTGMGESVEVTENLTPSWPTTLLYVFLSLGVSVRGYFFGAKLERDTYEQDAPMDRVFGGYLAAIISFGLLMQIFAILNRSRVGRALDEFLSGLVSAPPSVDDESAGVQWHLPEGEPIKIMMMFFAHCALVVANGLAPAIVGMNFALTGGGDEQKAEIYSTSLGVVGLLLTESIFLSSMRRDNEGATVTEPERVLLRAHV